MTKLEQAQELVMKAMRAEIDKSSEHYINLRMTLTELEDVYELDELSDKSKHNLEVLGFKN